MYNFFVSESSINDNKVFISGKDFNHIKNVLRLKEGETFLVSADKMSHLCRLNSYGSDFVQCEIIEKNYQDTSLPIKIVLFQGLPKSDKLELIIQKAVELGVDTIIPVQMSRSIVKYDDKKAKSKVERFQAIAESAAKQSKRTKIPKVQDLLSFNEAVKVAKDLDLFLLPYENKKGIESTKECLSLIKSGDSVGIMIGPEGGFDDREIELAENSGAKLISLGKRILRTETAAITAMSMCMLYAEMKL